MDYNDYTFNFKLESEIFDPFPQNFTMGIHDSIFSFLPEAYFIYEDQTALLNEYRAFAEGIQMPIEFGFREGEVISLPYLINSTQTTEIGSKSQGIMAGRIQANLIHSWIKDYLTPESKAFEGKISDVLPEVLEGIPFNDTIISDTVNKGIWYQSMISKGNFIEMLLHNAQSASKPDAPYLGFVDSRNNFFFSDYDSLYSQSTVADLEYSPLQKDFLNENTIKDIEAYSLSFSDYFHSLKVEGIHTVMDDFSMAVETKRLPDKTTTGVQSFAWKETERSAFELPQSYYLDGDTFMQENAYGRHNSVNKYSFFTDKLIIHTFLHPEITAGTTVNLTISTQDSSGITDSLYYSGKWLVEDSMHSWDGSRGMTKIVVSRNSVDMPSDYKIKEKLFQ